MARAATSSSVFNVVPLLLVALLACVGLVETLRCVVIQTKKCKSDDSIGFVGPNVSLKVVDLKTGKTVGPNVEGELCVKMPDIFVGYYNDPIRTKELFDNEGAAQGLRCYKCGQYNEGVGSITPCINYTATQLKDCSANSQYCIKYVSEGSIVRDCVPTCTEKEAWSTRTYCCKEDGCNGALATTAPTSLWLSATAALVLLVTRALSG